MQKKRAQKDQKFVSLGLSPLEIERVSEIKNFFDLNSSAGAVRKCIAFLATVVKHAGEDGSIEVTDVNGKTYTIILA